MIHFDEQALRANLNYTVLAQRIGQFMAEGTTTPQRVHLDYPNPLREDATLLLMPSWRAGEYLGVKIVTVTPDNGQYNLPAIHGHYLLFHAATGELLATMDGKILTNIRTAAASLFAAQQLANPTAKNYLMVGTGNLVEDYAKAFSSHFELEHLFIWGRNFEKAQTKATLLSNLGLPAKAVENLTEVQKKADLISSLTLSKQALLLGQNAKPNQHYDLVGAYKADRRETDGALIQQAAVWVDTLHGALHEAGDIIQAIQEGVFKADLIKGTVADLFHQSAIFKPNQKVTVFKSVGHAAQDLAAATLIYEMNS